MIALKQLRMEYWLQSNLS